MEGAQVQSLVEEVPACHRAYIYMHNAELSNFTEASNFICNSRVLCQALKWLRSVRYPTLHGEDRQPRLFLALLFGGSSHINIPQISC